MGRGLFRLYLALWLMWFSYGVVDNYKELAAYVGYENWTSEKAAEKNKIRCDANPRSDKCVPEGWVDTRDIVSEDTMEVVVWMFVMAMIKAPFYLLLFLTAMYWLVKWVIVGFRRKH